MSLPEKPFYTLNQLAECWSIPVKDIGGYALTKELTLSIIVVKELTVVVVGKEAGKQGRRHRLSPGIVPVIGFDVWQAFKGETVTLTRLAGDTAETALAISARDQYQTVKLADLVVRTEEKRRFEAAGGAEDGMGVPGNCRSCPHRTGSRGGAPNVHDWDGVWIDHCIRVHNFGMPETQAELVRQANDWFAVNTDRVPDDRQVKSKMRRFWRKFHSS